MSALARSVALGRAIRLEVLTVGWNLVEGTVGIAGALASGSTALLGFAADSFVESLSGGILLWRLRGERTAGDPEAIEALERTARRLVAVTFFVLAAYVAFEAATKLWQREDPRPSWIGIVLPLASMGVMAWLARAKKQAALELGSRALAADAHQTSACWWLSLVTLVGIGLNAAFGLGWADPVAALAISGFLVHEGVEAWSDEEHACC